MASHFQNYEGSKVYTHFLFKEKEMNFPLIMFQWAAIPTQRQYAEIETKKIEKNRNIGLCTYQ